jgi:hypothetical protein
VVQSGVKLSEIYDSGFYPSSNVLCTLKNQAKAFLDPKIKRNPIELTDGWLIANADLTALASAPATMSFLRFKK